MGKLLVCFQSSGTSPNSAAALIGSQFANVNLAKARMLWQGIHSPTETSVPCSAWVSTVDTRHIHMSNPTPVNMAADHYFDLCVFLRLCYLDELCHALNKLCARLTAILKSQYLLVAKSSYAQDSVEAQRDCTAAKRDCT